MTIPIPADPGGGDALAGDPAGGDLAGGDLEGGDLAGGDLAGGDLAGGDLAGGDLAGGDLEGGDLEGGDLAGGDLEGGDLAGGDSFQGGDTNGPPLSCSNGFRDGDETGIDCGGALCEPCAVAVECRLPADCLSGVCTGNVCAKPTCSDGVANGDETGLDCGGHCPPCAASGGCLIAADCASLVCLAGVCAAASCSDGLTNGDETGLDCGGSCPACTVSGAGCVDDGDCAGLLCLGGECSAATCANGLPDAGETTIDCGGPDCPPCAAGDACSDDGDCRSGICSDTTGLCLAASCSDGVSNGSETGVDCGGSCPLDCPAWSPCNTGTDCLSGVCAGGVCRAPTCYDGVRNGDETGVDCGGSCQACASGAACLLPADCLSGVCWAGICLAPSCYDGVLNGDETGVDCGGDWCGDCGGPSGCRDGSDCASGVCFELRCLDPACDDLVQNGDETGLDCGGSCPDGCPLGEGCSEQLDCAEGSCVRGVCSADSCTDGVLNGAETGSDCGGPACPACPTGQVCSVTSDCTSGVCEGGLCQAPSCSDGVANGTESDVDCGGACAPCSVPGDECLLDADCASRNCVLGVCQAATCYDTVHNGTESDTDCGGSCADCANGQACDDPGDCASGLCVGGTCVAAGCTNGLPDGQETAVDCGGPVCQPCADGLGCAVDADCRSLVCDGDLCQAPTCFDGTRNGSETGLDCGGTCLAGCPTGAGCLVAADCIAGVCSGGICRAPDCSDGVRNGTESGVDCGGDLCAACPASADCGAPSDCQSGVCSGGVCQDPSCADGVANGLETGVDCGGPCAGCPDGAACREADDCRSGVCAGGLCQVPSCGDGVYNGLESDTDCGGPCPGCDLGDGCTDDGDCAAGSCLGGVCAPASCANGLRDGTESDTDCGGPVCPDCADGLLCGVAADCQSGVCNGGRCAAPTCTDGVQNGTESDVDCGAACDPDLCPAGERCLGGADCLSGVCLGGLCQAPTCSDVVRNGSESDTDCGGPTCPDCADGSMCSAPGDCRSGVCTAGRCAAPTCSDNVKNGQESDVDCGAACAPDLCLTGEDCLLAADCVSAVCSGGTCQAATCGDGVKNGGESGVDCGGPTCPRCPAGQTCLLPGDCLSGVCTGGLCAAPTCGDGIKNGTESDVDCGGSCPGCDKGEHCLVDADCLSRDCAGGVCVGLSVSDVFVASANRTEGIVALVTGTGFVDQDTGAGAVNVYLLLATACAAPGSADCVTDTLEGVSKLTFEECAAPFTDCGSQPTAFCYDANAEGTQLLLAVCDPALLATLIYGFYDLRLEAPRAAPVDEAVAARAIKYNQRVSPTITAVSPDSAYRGLPGDGLIADTGLVLTGADLQATPTVRFVNVNDPALSFLANGVEFVSATRLNAIVPSETQGMPLGAYHVQVINPDGQGTWWVTCSAAADNPPPCETSLLQRGLFRITGDPPPYVASIDPPRSSQQDFPLTLIVGGEHFVVPSSGAGTTAALILPNGSACPVTTTVTSPTQLAAVIPATACGDALGAWDVFPIRVTNPDGQYYVYYSLIVYPNSVGKLDSWLAGPALQQRRAFLDSELGFDDLRSAFIYAAGGVDCTSGTCPKLFTDWDTGGVTLLGSVEFARVNTFGQMDPWQYLRTIEYADASGVRVRNDLRLARAGHVLLRAGRFFYALGGRTSTADYAAATPLVERARVLGLESMPGIQWARQQSTAEDLADGTAGALPPGLYFYRVSAVGSEGEGLGSREVALQTERVGANEVQWEAFRDPQGQPVPSSYVLYRSLEPLGRGATSRRVAYLFRPAPMVCKRPDGSLSGASGCVRFVDDGRGALLITPSLLSLAVNAGGGTLAAGNYEWRLAARNAGGTVAAAGYPYSVAVTAGASVTITWEQVGGASAYYLYRRGLPAGAFDCVVEVPAGAGAPGSFVSYTDTGTSGGCSQALVEPDRPLPRGSLTRWQILDDNGDSDGNPLTANRLSLNQGREGASGLSLTLPVPGSPSGATRGFLYVHGGRSQAGSAGTLTYLRSTERVEVDLTSGAFRQVDSDGDGTPDYASPVRFWDYERPTLTAPGDCEQAAPANCIQSVQPRAYHSLITTYGRNENQQPALPPSPCDIPDGDGDGFSRIECGGQDCNDADPDIYPGAPEDCADGIDSNCDGCVETVGDVYSGCCDCSEPDYRDHDRDGYWYWECCQEYNASAACASGGPAYLYDCDCDDLDATVFPGAPEICEDGRVNDCRLCTLSGSNAAACDDGPGSCADCDAPAEADYACVAGDDPACGGGDPCSEVDPDLDNDGHANAGYAGHATYGACCGPSGVWLIPCDDCDDSRASVHPGAVEVCGNGLDDDCVGGDAPCSGCWDDDGDGYDSWACGGADCVDNWVDFCNRNPGPNVCYDECDPLNPPIYDFDPALINPGMVGDNPFGALCGNCVDDDCDGLAPSCLDDYTFPSLGGSPPGPIEPLMIGLTNGTASFGGGVDQAGSASNTKEAALLENQDPTTLGHLIWVDPCTTNPGFIYRTPTCGVRGWYQDSQASDEDAFGARAAMYYNFAFVFGGARPSNPWSTLGQPGRDYACPLPDSGDPCPVVGNDVWRIDQHLYQTDTAAAAAQLGNARAFHAMERIYSFLYVIGGVAGNGWSVTTSIEYGNL